MKLAIFAALAATAVAQVAQETTVTGADGTLTIERRQQLDTFQLAATVSQLQATVSRLEARQDSTINTMTSTMAAGGTAAAVASDMASRTMTLMSTATANQVRLDAAEATLEGVTAGVATQMSVMQAAAAAAAAEQSTTLSATVSNMTGTMDGRITEVLASLASTATALRAQQTTGSAQLAAAVNVQLRQVNTSLDAVNTALASKRSAASHMWVGTCSNHGNGGWREYCYNRIEVDTARPMFRKESNVRMRSIVSGYFMMHFHRMLQTCNWAHTLLYFNGEARIYTHDWQGGNSHWRDDRATLTYPLGANQQFWARVWNGCWSNWHTGAYHTKFHAMYKGAIPA